MAATAPFCNVTVFTPPPDPIGPKGFKTIPAGATLAQVIQIVNDNVNNAQRVFDQHLAADTARGVGTRTGGKQNESLVAKAAQREISRISFIEKSIVRKRIRVYNPEDRSQYIIDDRVVALTMQDSRTGAVWVFRDPGAERPAG